MRLCTALTPRFSLSRRLLAGLLTAWLLFIPSTVFAAPGDLDLAFGTGGKVTTDFDLHHNRAQALVIQPDGKLVAARGPHLPSAPRPSLWPATTPMGVWMPASA